MPSKTDEHNKLAEQFAVSLRTIQRDLNVRFQSLALKREGKLYKLDPRPRGKFQYSDIEHFANLAGVRCMFPQLTRDCLRYWLPHIRIISPEDFQERLEAGLRAYLGLESRQNVVHLT